MTEETIHDQEPEVEHVDEGIALLLEQVEELVPPVVRKQVTQRPFTFMLLGVGVGLFLGVKKGNELLAAGAAMLTSALAANVSSVFGGEARDQ